MSRAEPDNNKQSRDNRPPSTITRILSAIGRGDARAADELLPLVYEELRILAAQRLSQERPGQTLQATALVHEAYIRLVEQEDQNWNSRRHFFAAAAEASRLSSLREEVKRVADSAIGMPNDF